MVKNYWILIILIHLFYITNAASQISIVGSGSASFTGYGGHSEFGYFTIQNTDTADYYLSFSYSYSGIYNIFSGSIPSQIIRGKGSWQLSSQTSVSYTIRCPQMGGNYSGSIKVYWRRNNGTGSSGTCTFNVSVKTKFDPVTPPRFLHATNTSSSITLFWDHPLHYGDGGLRGYNVYLNGSLQNHFYGTTPTHTFNSLEQATVYDLAVRAVDQAGNISEPASLTVATDCHFPRHAVYNKDYSNEKISPMFIAGNVSVTLAPGFRYAARDNRSLRVLLDHCEKPWVRPYNSSDIFLDEEDSDILEMLPAEVLSESDDIKLYPNPTSDIIAVNMGEVYKEINNIEIYNLSGSIICKREPTNVTEIFEMYQYSKGIYIVKLTFADSKTLYYKFILK